MMIKIKGIKKYKIKNIKILQGLVKSLPTPIYHAHVKKEDPNLLCQINVAD